MCVCVCEKERETVHLSFLFFSPTHPVFLLSTPPPSPSPSPPPSSRPPSLSLPADREKMHQLEEEEKALKEENVRLQRRLLRETERREQMRRQLSESESSLEMDDER